MKHSSIQILLTIGATIEPIDPVRYLSNWSSGTLGCAIALAAASAGHRVTVLHGKQSLIPQKHPRITAVPFDSTRDLAAKCKEFWPSQDLLIMAAAVADFTPAGGAQNEKIRRGDSHRLDLVSTDDVVADLTRSKRDEQRLMAFSLASKSQLIEIAQEKLNRKSVDAIVANPLSTMNSKEIEGVILTRDGKSLKPDTCVTKPAFAKWLVSVLPELMK